MPKKILLIENDSSFAAGVSESLEASGFDVRVTGDGKEGLDLAREWGPEAIVLCVELPGMSGYLVCQKLKKDEALKELPLVLTSAEATEETFEKHRTLKARADEYLLKPYAPASLIEKLGALVGLPEPGAASGGDREEELVSLEEEMGLEALPSEPAADLPNLDLESLPDEPAAPASGLSGDDDLSLLDEAFDGLASRPPTARQAAEALDLLDEKPAPAPAEEPSGPDPVAALGDLDAETDAALGALGASGPAPEAERPTIRGASADLLRAAGIKLLDDPFAASPLAASPAAAAPPPPRGAQGDGAASSAAVQRLERELAEAREALADAREAATAREGELRGHRSRADDSVRRAEEAEAAAAERDVELAALKARLDALGAQGRKADGDLKAVREEARRAADRASALEAEAAELKKRAGDAERRAETAEAEARRKGEEASRAAHAAGRVETLERELEDLRTELVVARGETEGARGEVEKRTAELKKRISELEASNAKNEERVLRAYQKIKGDEKVKDKVRKALAIAGQLLEEGLPPDAPADKPRPAAAATLLGRE